MNKLKAAWLRRFGVILLAFNLLAFASNPAAARRLALVIGNAAYQYTPRLQNTLNDARAFGETLKNLGFEVTIENDLTKDQTLQIVTTFTAGITGEDTVVFFYAGHAIQVDGQNYLVAIDTTATNEKDAVSQSVPLNSVIENIANISGQTIILLDACRDNPLKVDSQDSSILDRREEGLARTNISSRNTLIAFATEPGNVALDGQGNHSPFTKALLKYVSTPALEVSAMLNLVRRQVFDDTKQKQLPWTSSSLLNNFYFAEALEDGSAIEPSAPSRVQLSRDPASLLAAANELFAAGSLAQSADIFRQAAELGAVRAMTSYAHLLSEGTGIQRNEAEAHQWYLKAANLGDPQAQFQIGRNYERGSAGLSKNAKEAFDWYSRAAQGGDSDAMNNLAVMYAFGEGVETDSAQAVQWYSKAAEAGSGNAMFNLGAMYDEGRGVKKSPDDAARWVIRAILAKIEPARLEMTTNSAAWSKEFRRSFQKELKKAGLYDGPIDGEFGKGTVNAILKLK